MRAMTEGPAPLDPDRATAEAWLARCARLALDQIEALSTGPAVGVLGPAGLEAADRASVSVPEEPLPGGIDAALRRIELAATAALLPAGPGYFAYVPGSGLWTAALADLVGDALNRFTGHAVAAPGFARLEADVLAWLAREFGYDDASRGLFTSGGSIANLTAFVTARHHALGDTGDFRHALAYTSGQAHHSVTKGLRLAGLPGANVRTVAVDDRLRMRPDRLRDQVQRDRDAGLRPFLVVASAGTTNTGAVDPLARLSEVCAQEGLWLHVDAAYGGAFVLCDEGRARLSGIGAADSITFDPHKGLFLPFGTGCLLVRDGRRLRAAHDAHGAYLQDFDRVDRTREPPSATLHGPELSRSFRGLRLWLPLMVHGARAFREALAEKLKLARTLHMGIEERIGGGAPLEIAAPTELSTVTFRLTRDDGDSLEAWNARNAVLLESINAHRRVYLSSTTLPGSGGEVFTLRACVLGLRTHARDVQALLEDLDRSSP